ncbi:ABC transporter substrate-binding protein [Chitinilyticum piscinae]|uniref:Extracellular solute-binding protein n=1 Tax=Chitinilyticum piscinae TaxID=2866724 RepID=A0A8J7G1E5_9NEIS|nr:extracellular solute-binding protein [Chitinilyticum piscinae]MBE9610205.1 extracellular solute-binding protein [Chitinilyticum piscinae]
MKHPWKALCTSAMLALLAQPALADKVKIEFWTMSLAPKFEPYFKALEKKYEAENPNIDVVWVDYPWDQIRGKAFAAIAVNQPPALINFNVEWAYDFAQFNNIRPIDDLLGTDRDKYSPGALADVTFKGGKTYAFPWYNAVSILAVNSNIFKQAGLNPTQRLNNLDEQLAAAKIIAEKTKIPGLAPRLGQPIGLFMAEGLPIVEGGKAVFNSPKHVELLRKYAAAYAAGALAKDDLFAEDSFQTTIKLYNAGKLAMLETPPTALKSVKDEGKAVYGVTEVMPAPAGPTGVVKGGWLFNFVVPKNVNPAILPEVAKFAKYLTNDANQLEFSKATGGTFPSVRQAAQDSFFQKLPANAGALEKGRAIGAASLENVRTLTLLGVANPDPLRKKLVEEVESAVTGRKDAKAALDSAAAFWNANMTRK